MSPQDLPLSAAEQEILRTQREGLPPLSPPKQRHRTVLAYASHTDRLFLAVGCFFAIVGGALNPLLTVIYGRFVASFQDFEQGTEDGAALSQQVDRFCLYFVYLAIAMFVSIYITTTAFFLCSENVMLTLRRTYLTSVLRQNIAFFDNLGPGYVSSCLTSDCDLIYNGISGKLSLSLTAAATFCTAVIITFAESWRLALVLLSTVVAITIVNFFGTKAAVRFSHSAQAAYDSAATVAEEALRSMKHILAFGIQGLMADRYKDRLARARVLSFKARAASGTMTGFFMGIMYLSSGLSFWQGSRFLVLGDITASAIVTCSMSIIIGALAIGKVAPNAQAFVSSITSAKRLLTTIHRRSTDDPLGQNSSTKRLDQTQLAADICLQGVSLVYPSRDDCLILDDLSLTFAGQKTTAIIGASGCGKSSIVGLLERFYQPVRGSVSIAGVNVRDLDLSWWRSQVSLVGQEPVLFHTTIFENIKHGLGDSGKGLSDETITALVEQAARDAYAHDFIQGLPDGYHTNVGEASARLSGGQRQRIAIARALISNPSILLLDEATAALDSKSEALVMKALGNAAKGRTTLLITHRLSTLQNVDSIIVMSKGRMVESGSHEELLELDGLYAKAVKKQSLIVQKDSASDVITEDSLCEKPVVGSQNSPPETIAAAQDFEKTLAEVEETTVVEDRDSEKGPKQKSAKEDGEQMYSTWTLIRMACSFNRPEMPIVIVGLISCVIAGSVNPVQSIFFANSIDSLSLPLSMATQIRSQIDFWSAMYLMLGLVALLAWSGQGVCLAYCAEAMVLRTRVSVLKTILRQDGEFFDNPKYSSGTISHVLSSSATHIAGLSGAVLGTILTAFATLAGGIILSLVIGWKLALVCTATIPIVLGCGWARLMVLSAMEAKVRKAHAETADYASEAIMAIRTVASLTLEQHVLATYEQRLRDTIACNRRAILQSSALYAASQSVVFLVAALGFWYGGTLIGSHEYSMVQYFICFAALVSGSQSVGAVFSFAPDLGKAKHAGVDIKRLLDTVPHIDAESQAGRRLLTCNGRLDLRNLNFSYPSRPGQVVLKDFSLTAASGQFIAIVGSSGSGKSTIVSLLERFYDPDQGSILLDGEDIRNLHLQDYRRLFAYVGQEPIMYKGTIRDNLSLCADGLQVTEDQMIAACEQAYIKEYIESLPNGLDTDIGSKGVMLSGGQKQRLAIARALLRNAPLLILDEATSALDSDSEKAVQAALNSIQKSRTTIAVAHRLNTIQHADEIYVLDEGRLIEKGTHAELIRRRGKYAEMYELQTLERGDSQ